MSESSELWEEGLNGPDKLFVLEYCRSYNIYKAYRVAHPDAGDASVRGNAARVKKRLEDAISKLMAELVKGHRAELEAQLLMIYRVRGTYDIHDLYDDKGFLKPPDELQELCYVVDEVSAFEVVEGRGKKRKKTIRFQPKKLANRQENLDKLDRIISLIKPEDRAGEGGGGGFVLLPQNMTTEDWIAKYGSGSSKNKNQENQNTD